MASRCGRSWEKAKCVIVQEKEVSCPGMVQTNCSACSCKLAHAGVSYCKLTCGKHNS